MRPESYEQAVINPDISDGTLAWKKIRQVFPQPRSLWRKWLLDQRSLTKLLVKHSHGNFAVQLVEESWWHGHSVYLREVLGPQLARQRMWSRKVVLQGNGKPWVAAHTLVPQASLSGQLVQVKQLQSKPLGAFLFSQPGLKRCRLDVVRTGDGWGRCSVFVLDGHPIVVAEFFLPSLVLGNP